MLTLALLTVVTAAPPATVADLERTAPSSTWKREPLPALAAEIVTLPTKAPSRFVVKGDRVAVARLESAAPLFAPLDDARARAVVDAFVDGAVVDDGAVARVEAAGFKATLVPPEPPRRRFSFSRLVLRHADSAPALVFVVVDLDADGGADVAEFVVAAVAVDVGTSGAPQAQKTKTPDRSAEIARFVAAARGTAVRR